MATTINLGWTSNGVTPRFDQGYKAGGRTSVDPPSASALFSDDFNSQTLGANPAGGNDFFQWGGGASRQVSTDQAYSGSQSLRFRFAGNPDPAADSTSEQRFILSSTEKELWIRYKLWIPTNYSMRVPTGASNNKGLIMLWGNGEPGYSNGPTISLHFQLPSDLVDGVSQTNPNGSIIYGSWRPNELVVRNYPDPANLTQDSFGSVPPTRGITASHFGQWNDIVIHAKTCDVAVSGANDFPAGRNGALQLWINGELVYGLENAHNYFDLHGGADGWDRGYLLGWANTGFDEQTDLFIDDFQIGRTSDSVGFVGGA